MNFNNIEEATNQPINQPTQKSATVHPNHKICQNRRHNYVRVRL